MDTIKQISGCSKLKSRSTKHYKRKLNQNCSQKCKNAIKKGFIYKSFKKQPSGPFDIRDRNPDICGRVFKPLSQKEKAFKKKTGNRFWIKNEKDWQKFQKHLKLKKNAKKEFKKSGQKTLITEIEDCSSLKSKRLGNVTKKCKELCKNELKKGHWFKVDFSPTYCGGRVRKRSSKKK